MKITNRNTISLALKIKHFLPEEMTWRPPSLDELTPTKISIKGFPGISLKVNKKFFMRLRYPNQLSGNK